jgi:hypothetical protein
MPARRAASRGIRQTLKQSVESLAVCAPKSIDAAVHVALAASHTPAQQVHDAPQCPHIDLRTDPQAATI